jgi:hypothetical protein
MPCYLVRIIDSKEAVGIFYVADIDELCEVIDEATDPGICEYALMPHGGVMWPRPHAKAIPLGDIEWEHEKTPMLELIGRIEPSQLWSRALIDTDNFRPLLTPSHLLNRA